MNLKTTLLLAVLLAAGAGAWYWLAHRAPDEPPSATRDFLESELKPERVTRVEVRRGQEPRFTLEKINGRWTLPGRWPVRQHEVEQWLTQLAGMHTRFAPLPLGEDAEKKEDKVNEAPDPRSFYGLTDAPLVIKLTLDGKERTLTLGEEPGEANRFTRPTYLQLDGNKEVVRLGPGVATALDRRQDYFQQRRLFPVERVAKTEEGFGKDKTEKVEQLAAATIEAKGPDGRYRVSRQGENWQLQEPVVDRVDPSRIKTLLTNIPDLWAEKFVELKDKKLEDLGLTSPEYVLTVTPTGGKEKDQVQLLIGSVSDKKTRVVRKPAPPAQFGQPPQPQMQIISEEFRYAKLAGNEQVFEVKADKLPEIVVAVETLRDPQLARFHTRDVRRLEIQHRVGDAGDPKKQREETIVLVKESGSWRMEQPGKEEAETRSVEEVLDKLADLRVEPKDILDKADPKAVGLDQPLATLKVTVEEEKDKKTREHVFRLGTKVKDKDKVYIRVDDWARVNPVPAGEEGLLKLVSRPALAYRNRRVLDVVAADLRRLEVQRPGETYALEKQDGAWKLAAPVKAEVDSTKATKLAEELGKLDAAEFVTADPKSEDLDKVYGLAKPELSVKLAYQDAKKKPEQTLTIGKKRPDKEEYFARVDGGPVFAVKKELRDELDRASLSYRPLELWKLDPAAITEVTVNKAGTDHRLRREGDEWKIISPFEAPAVKAEAQEVIDAAGQLKAQRYEAHEAKDLSKYGLDKPAVKVEITAKDGKHTLAIGKPVEGEPAVRYARAEPGTAVVVLDSKTVTALERSPLDLLDKELLALDTKGIERIRFAGESPFALQRTKGEWQVIDAPAPPFAPDSEAVQDTLRPWQNLRAARIAAYGPKINWSEFGLDKPARTVTVDVAKDATSGKNGAHAVALGKELPDGQRYARLDQRDAVVVLDAPTAADLGRTHLDFVDRRVLKYDLDTVTGLKRQMKDADLELAKHDDSWELVKPVARPADNVTVNDILEKTFRLQARRVAAYPAKDLKPFGLDQPTAVVTLELTDASGAPSTHVLRVGKQTGGKGETDERFAIIDKGDTVVVLPVELSRHLVAPVLYFADRNLASFSGASQVSLERGPRKAAFAKSGATWQMVEPIKADAESADLEDFVRSLQRLRADEIVADKGADLKKYGLDQPAAQWHVKAGTREAMHLLVGRAEKPDEKEPRHFAKLADKDEVFLLSGKLAARALGEYRDRKPWPALDAAQAERLTVTAGSKSYTLRKREEAWTALSDPGATVNTKAVTDTLDALAGLKVERYVVDAKADRKLYGLEPPAWTIEVQTPTAKRTLLLGRTEGDSKRFYAAVSDGEGVFVLGEEDGRRIARPLSAFLQQEKAARK